MIMRSTFKILFYLNTSKRKKSGLCPVMGRITVDGSVAQFSLKEEIHSVLWDAKKGRTNGKTREQIALNRKIEQTEQSVRNIYERTIDTIGYVTAEQIKNELTGVTSKTDTLLKLFSEHNAEYEKRVEIDRKAGSYYIYQNSYKHLSRFVKSKYGIDDFPLKQLDMSFIKNYDYYLRVDAKISSNTMVRHIELLQKMVYRAVNKGIILHYPFPDYVKNKQEWKFQHISGDEFERLITTNIQSKAVCFIRDMFVFSCFTGLAAAEMRNLSEKHLRKVDGVTWISIPRQKTGVESNIRLLDIPLKIIEKYRPIRKGDALFNMPKSGCLISYHLRKIEKLCNIKHLHYHMARHTFATLICLTNGVSMEALSKMMGHSTMRSTQIYAEITSQKVGEDMKKLAKRIKSEKSKK